MCLFTEIILGRLSKEVAISKYCCIVCILLACVSNYSQCCFRKEGGRGMRRDEHREENVSGYTCNLISCDLLRTGWL